MATVLLNALASTAGGGVTYLRNVLPRLGRDDDGLSYIVLVPPAQLAACRALNSERVRVESLAIRGGMLGRWCWEQTALRWLIHARQVKALVSLGNFALLTAPVPQLLFNRNALYFSTGFARDLWARGEYVKWLEHQAKSWLAWRSIKHATVNLVPSFAMREQVRRFVGLSGRITVLPFGFDKNIFSSDNTSLSAELLAKLDLQPDCRRLLFVSHYNYFRNFETLLRALPELKRLLRERAGLRVQIVLTTELRRGAVYGGYDATAAAALIEQLGVRAEIAMLGSVPYEQLYQLYRMCDGYICPSYAESFGHPLVEAMASGLPVVAADLPVHQEICGDAAVYFETFDVQVLAAQAASVLTDTQLSRSLCHAGAQQIQRYSWDEHVASLICEIKACIGLQGRGAQN